MIHEFNLALQGKQLWRLVQYTDLLVARVLREKYYRCSWPLRLNKTDNGWTSIMAAKPLISLGIRQKIHFWNVIRVWEDLWIPTIPARPARPIAPVLHPMFPVRELITGTPKRWNPLMLENYVNPNDIPLIQSLVISQRYHRDEYCWSYTKNGRHTVKSGYWVARNLLNKDNLEIQIEPTITKLQAFAWKIQAPPKIKYHIWKLISGQLAVTSNLKHRHMQCDNYCPRCGAED